MENNNQNIIYFYFIIVISEKDLNNVEILVKKNDFILKLYSKNNKKVFIIVLKLILQKI